MKKLFLKKYMPEFVMNPHDANMELIGRHGELVDLEEIEGRVALEGALPYRQDCSASSQVNVGLQP